MTVAALTVAAEGKQTYLPQSANPTPVIGFHGHGGNYLTPANFETPEGYSLLADSGFICRAQTWGGDTWGNDASLALIDAAYAELISAYGARANKVCLYAGSMGAAPLFNWARTNKTKIAAIAVTAPAVNLTRLHDVNINGYGTAEIEAAYGGLAAWNAAKATHDPTLYAASLVGVPICVWYSLGDVTIIPADIDGFAPAAGATTVQLPFNPPHAFSIPAMADVRAWFQRWAQ